MKNVFFIRFYKHIKGGMEREKPNPVEDGNGSKFTSSRISKTRIGGMESWGQGRDKQNPILTYPIAMPSYIVKRSH